MKIKRLKNLTGIYFANDYFNFDDDVIEIDAKYKKLAEASAYVEVVESKKSKKEETKEVTKDVD